VIDFTEVENSIYRMVQPILNCPTIFAKQTSPRPTERTYATIDVGNHKQLGRGESASPDDTTGLADVWAHYEVSVQFAAYGPEAKNAITKLQFAFNKDEVVDAFLAEGMAVVSHDDILDIPAIRDTIWEESSRFNATFHARIEDTDNVGVIAEVSVDGELSGAVDDPLETSITITTIAP